ncbi:MAG: hypothetical protein N2Z74_03510 [Syntrophales bacterium]|nr:hypothetical protein [Syntrophales bacterium]
MYWERYPREEITRRFALALDRTINYRTDAVVGFPATYCDAEDCYAHGCSVLCQIPWASPVLNEEPLLRALIENPNHIGCQTAEKPEIRFSRTRDLGREALAICTEAIMGAPKGGYGGYISSGGTENNTQACWMLCNVFRRTHGARPGEIGLVSAADMIDTNKMPKDFCGAGIFLCRKGLINKVCTTQASYVHGRDYT